MARILIIEDDAAFRRMLTLMLRKAGYDVLEAAEGNEGILIYGKYLVDLVITDVFMPEKEGIQTVMELKEINPEVIIIAISGGGSPERLEYLKNIKEFGAHKTFEKPFDMKDFLATVEDLLQPE